MSRVTPTAPHTDWWAIALFSLAVGALLAGGLMSPAVFTQAQTVDIPATLLGLAGLVSAVALFALGGSVAPRTRLGIALMAFLAWAFVAAMASGRALAAFVGEPTNLIGFWAIASLAAIGLAIAWRGSAAREVLEIAAPWLLMVQIGWVALSFLRVDWSQPFVADLVARGTLPNSTGLGQGVLLLLPWLLALQTTERLRLPRGVRIAVAVVAVAVLAIGQSRVALAVALLWACTVLLARARLSQRTQSVVRYLVIGAVALAAVGYVGAQLSDPRGGQLGLRPEFTRTTIAAVTESPLLGYGPDGFVAGGASVSTPEFVSQAAPLLFARGAVDPHNVLLLVAVSTGVVGLALFLWAIAEVFAALRARAREGEDIAPGSWATGGAFAVFLTAPASIAVLPLFAYVLGVTLIVRPLATPRQTRGAADIGLLVALGLSGLLLAANTLTRLPLERPSAQDSPRLARQAQSAADVWIADPYLAYLSSLHWAWAAQSDPSVVASRLDLAAIERAVALDSRDPFAALERTRVLRTYELGSDEIDAAYDETFRRWPLFPAARLEFAEYLIGLGHLDEARTQLGVVRGLAIDDTGFRETLDRLDRSAAGEAP